MKGALEERGGEGKRMVQSGASVERGRRGSSDWVDDRAGVKERGWAGVVVRRVYIVLDSVV